MSEEQKIVKLLNMAEESIRSMEGLTNLLNMAGGKLGMANDKGLIKDIESLYTSIGTFAEVFQRARKGDMEFLSKLQSMEQDYLSNLVSARKKFDIIDQALTRDGITYDPKELFANSVLDENLPQSNEETFSPTETKVNTETNGAFDKLVDIMNLMQIDVRQLKDFVIAQGGLVSEESKKEDEKQTSLLQKILGIFDREEKNKKREQGTNYVGKLLGNANAALNFSPDGFLSDLIKYKVIAKVSEIGIGMLTGFLNMGARLMLGPTGIAIIAGAVGLHFADWSKSFASSEIGELLAKNDGYFAGIAGGMLVGSIFGPFGSILGAVMGGIAGKYIQHFKNEWQGQYGKYGTEAEAAAIDSVGNYMLSWVDVFYQTLGDLIGLDKSKMGRFYYHVDSLKTKRDNYENRMKEIYDERQKLTQELIQIGNDITIAEKEGDTKKINSLKARLSDVRTQIDKMIETENGYRGQVAIIQKDIEIAEKGNLTIWDRMHQFFKDWGIWIGTNLSDFYNYLIDTDVGKTISGAIETVKDGAMNVFGGISNKFSLLYSDYIEPALNSIFAKWVMASTKLIEVKDFLLGGFADITTFFVDSFKWIGDVIGGAFTKLKELWNDFTKLISDAIDMALQPFRDIKEFFVGEEKALEPVQAYPSGNNPYDLLKDKSYFPSAKPKLQGFGRGAFSTDPNVETRKLLMQLGTQMLNNNTTSIVNNNSGLVIAPSPADTRNPYLGNGR